MATIASPSAAAEEGEEVMVVEAVTRIVNAIIVIVIIVMLGSSMAVLTKKNPSKIDPVVSASVGASSYDDVATATMKSSSGGGGCASDQSSRGGSRGRIPFIVVSPIPEEEAKYHTTTPTSTHTVFIGDGHVKNTAGYDEEYTYNGMRRKLLSALQEYHNEGMKLLHGLSQSLEVVLHYEQEEQQQRRRYGSSSSRFSNKNQDHQQQLYSDRLQQRIDRTAACLEENEVVLKQILLDDDDEPMKTIRVLPTTTIENSDDKNHDDDRKSKSSQSSPSSLPPPPPKPHTKMEHLLSTIFQRSTSGSKDNTAGGGNPSTSTRPSFCPQRGRTSNNKNSSNYVDENVYDSIIQIVAHLVRDWTGAGEPIRDTLYGWCRSQLDQHYMSNNLGRREQNRINNTQLPPILVPGAGLGRLAYDLAYGIGDGDGVGYNVEANELSPVMAAAAHGILKRRRRLIEEEQIACNTDGASTYSSCSWKIYPFIMDYMSNEVDSQRRFDSFDFPDFPSPATRDPIHSDGKTVAALETGYLSYTIGDWMGPYYQSISNHYGAIVTCFVIDTSTNVYDAIHTIAQLLRIDGGVWINVGPVQWHGNALLRPSVDELYEMIQSTNLFDIVHWSVDVDPIPYRHADDTGSGSSHLKPGDVHFVRTTHWEAYRPLRFVAIRRRLNQ